MVVLATGYKLEPAFAKLFGLPPHQPISDQTLARPTLGRLWYLHQK